MLTNKAMQGQIWITAVKLTQIKVKCHFSTALLPLRGSATAYERSGNAELTCGGGVCSCTPTEPPIPIFHLETGVQWGWIDLMFWCIVWWRAAQSGGCLCDVCPLEDMKSVTWPLSWGVMADSGFKGSRRAGRWLRSCHIIHSAWPFIFLESVPLPRQPAWLKRSQPLGSWTTTLCNCTCNLFNARIPWGK